MALNQQGAEGKRLGGRPVDVLARLEHLALGVELARDLAIEVEVGRHPGQVLADLSLRFQRHRRLSATLVATARDGEARPRALLSLVPFLILVPACLEVCPMTLS